MIGAAFINKVFKKLELTIDRSNISGKLLRIKQKQYLKKVRKKEIINVAFLAIHSSIWKYELVYNLLNQDNRFNVKVAIIPHVEKSSPKMDNYFACSEYFSSRGYNVIETYDRQSQAWLNLENIFDPDIVFFTNPHKLTYNKYYINQFKNKLTCYVPYAFVVIHNLEMHYYQPFFFKLWKYFLETSDHYKYAKKYLGYNSDQLIVTGYPSLDIILQDQYTPQEVWKEQSKREVKRIIWAPHHSIKGQGSGLDYSSFNEYAFFFLDVLNKRKDIQIAFKPHPLLKDKLYKDDLWGKIKTDEYYENWTLMANGQLEEGEYIDLFYLSDAMIMDSASFLAEYQFFNKPLLFTKKDEEVFNRFNTFGRSIFSVVYSANDSIEVLDFIDNVVVLNNDSMKDKREEFVKNVMKQNSNSTASMEIYNQVVNEVC